MEVLILVAVIGLVVSLAWPWILSARERARRTSCRNNLSQLGVALHAYHDVHQKFPPAAVWSTAQLESLALHRARRIDLITQANWAQAILPFTAESSLAEQFDGALLIAAPEHESARNRRISLMTCPDDPFNRVDNPFSFEGSGAHSIQFARGNYAINGGSHCFKDGPGTTAFLTGDASHLVMDRDTRAFQFWGNGVAGFNVSFSQDDFQNGSGTLVMLDEVRAGVHPVDPRGVWALGQIGGSVTWAHGVNGDAYGPNNQNARSDDLLDGDRLHLTVGSEFLKHARMPCVHYVDVNYQATARSMHPGGVHALMVDGAVRFVSDAIDPGLWHVIHSRETPPGIIEGDLDERARLSVETHERARDSGPRIKLRENAESTIRNSIGMSLALIPAGEFEMGIPDQGNNHDVPVDVPQHTVRLTESFYLGVHELTVSQYLRVMESGPAALGQEERLTEEGDFPIRNVTWNEAEAFCQRLSSRTEEKEAGRRYRLPTEAEWEYACRAGSREPYRWRAMRDPGDDSGEAGGIGPPLPLRPVGSFPPNAFGLYDMRGNVWEWCADWFDRDYYRRSPSQDPQGPRDGYFKVVRGNCWTFVGEGCKLSYPTMPPWKSSPFVGFRVVCELLPQVESVQSGRERKQNFGTQNLPARVTSRATGG